MGLSSRTAPFALAAAFIAGVAAVLLLVSDDSNGHSAQTAATPDEEAALIVANDKALREDIDAWLAAGDPPGAPPPAEVMSEAALLQDQVRSLAARGQAETGSVLAAVAAAAAGSANPDLATDLKDMIVAARKLRKLSKGSRNPNLKTGEPPPLSELVSHYAKAKRRSGIHPKYLAAIHHVETKFGRVKSKSVAGATGPMQFIPSTWKIYGRGGNIQDPHDAILAAGRLLRANGAPGNYSRALYAYNNSGLYVAAVHAYARLIGRDPYALEILYCWGP